jgi:transcriptional regulator with XRE-family HTH domain
MDLKLLQRQVAEQIGVHEMTITSWESNATVPEVRYMPAIIQFLGYNPLSAAGSFPERLASARRALGLSQRKMAKKLGVDPATLMGWEAGRHKPTGKSLDAIARVLQTRQRWRVGRMTNYRMAQHPSTTLFLDAAAFKKTYPVTGK